MIHNLEAQVAALGRLPEAVLTLTRQQSNMIEEMGSVHAKLKTLDEQENLQNKVLQLENQIPLLRSTSEMVKVLELQQAQLLDKISELHPETDDVSLEDDEHQKTVEELKINLASLNYVVQNLRTKVHSNSEGIKDSKAELEAKLHQTVDKMKLLRMDKESELQAPFENIIETMRALEKQLAETPEKIGFLEKRQSELLDKVSILEEQTVEKVQVQQKLDSVQEIIQNLSNRISANAGSIQDSKTFIQSELKSLSHYIEQATLRAVQEASNNIATGPLKETQDILLKLESQVDTLKNTPQLLSQLETQQSQIQNDVALLQSDLDRVSVVQPELDSNPKGSLLFEKLDRSIHDIARKLTDYAESLSLLESNTKGELTGIKQYVNTIHLQIVEDTSKTVSSPLMNAKNFIDSKEVELNDLTSAVHLLERQQSETKAIVSQLSDKLDSSLHDTLVSNQEKQSQIQHVENTMNSIQNHLNQLSDSIQEYRNVNDKVDQLEDLIKESKLSSNNKLNSSPYLIEAVKTLDKDVKELKKTPDLIKSILQQQSTIKDEITELKAMQNASKDTSKETKDDSLADSLALLQTQMQVNITEWKKLDKHFNLKMDDIQTLVNESKESFKSKLELVQKSVFNHESTLENQSRSIQALTSNLVNLENKTLDDQLIQKGSSSNELIELKKSVYNHIESMESRWLDSLNSQMNSTFSKIVERFTQLESEMNRETLQNANIHQKLDLETAKLQVLFNNVASEITSQSQTISLLKQETFESLQKLDSKIDKCSTNSKDGMEEMKNNMNQVMKLESRYAGLEMLEKHVLTLEKEIHSLNQEKMSTKFNLDKFQSSMNRFESWILNANKSFEDSKVTIKSLNEKCIIIHLKTHIV